MELTTILKLIDELDDRQKNIVVQHIEQVRSNERPVSQTASESGRVFGLFSHTNWRISPDFDDELPDEFWLGES